MTKKSSKPKFDPNLLDSLLENRTPEEIIGEGGLFKEIQKALLERVLNGEITSHLGYDKHDASGNNSGNSRNGHSTKTLKTEHGTISIDVPRDREGDFSPQIIPKHQTRFNTLDKKIVSLYARGMTTRDIQAQIQELYDVQISPSLVSEITNEVLEEVKAWQNRGLDKLYPIVFFDALMIKVKKDNRIINKAFYLALGVNLDGQKELLGIWVSENEGAKFWLNVLTDIKNRGVDDIFICCVDGLKGFPEAIEVVFPKAQTQLCIVHMIRNSLRFVGWQKRKEVAADLRKIYTAKTADEAEEELIRFAEKWDEQYPTISKSWQHHWCNLTPFYAYPNDIRKAIYTTNAIESVNMSLRKVIKNKRVFPSDEAAMKQLYLAINNISKKWTMPIRDWGAAMSRFMIMFEDRLEGLIPK